MTYQDLFNVNMGMHGCKCAILYLAQDRVATNTPDTSAGNLVHKEVT